MVCKTKLSINWVIRFVPYDIWRQIFYLISEPSGDATRDAGLLDVLRTSHVCSSWRNVTDNAPELWTNVVLEYAYGGRNGGFPNVEFLSFILSKSGDLPLTMEVAAPKEPTFCGPEDVEALELFLQNMHRSRILKVDLDVLNAFDAYLEDFLVDSSVLRQMKPGLLLKKLEIHARYEPEIGIPILAGLWRPAPSVQTLAFCGPYPHEFIGSAHTYWMQEAKFPFQQITSLELTCPINHEGLYALLSALPSLQNATLNYVYDVDEEECQLATVPELHTLSLGGPSYTLSEDDPSMMEILGCIASPALTTLRLSFVGEWSPTSFQTFLQNSTSQIKSLHFDITEANEDDRIDCLALLPTLRTLDLTSEVARTVEDAESYMVGEDFVDAMQEWDGSQNQFVLCPLLEKLIIDYDTLADTSTTAFADMIEDRWCRSAKGKDGKFELVIKRAGSLGDDPESHSEMIRLLLLKKAGLNLTVEPMTWLEKLIMRKLP